MFIKQNEGTSRGKIWYFACVDDTDGKTPEPGLTFAPSEIQILKAEGAFADHAGTVAEISDGLYSYDPDSGELDTLGALVMKVEKAGVRTILMQVAQVVPWNPFDAARLGMTDPIPDGGITAAKFAADAITAAKVAADVGTEIAAAVLAAAVEGSRTLKQTLTGLWSGMLAKVSGFDTGTLVFRDAADTKDRMTVVTASTGRTSVTITDLD